MATTINIREARTHLSRLLRGVESGEEIVIARAGHPCARLVPFQSLSEGRLPGRLAGRVSPSFFEPLPEELLDAWESG